MLCCKKTSYSPNKKQNNSNNDSKVNLTSTKKKYTSNFNTLASIRKKEPSKDKKDSLTVQFKSNLK